MGKEIMPSSVPDQREGTKQKNCSTYFHYLEEALCIIFQKVYSFSESHNNRFLKIKFNARKTE